MEYAPKEPKTHDEHSEGDDNADPKKVAKILSEHRDRIAEIERRIGIHHKASESAEDQTPGNADVRRFRNVTLRQRKRN
jgi:hypothetical protein